MKKDCWNCKNNETEYCDDCYASTSNPVPSRWEAGENFVPDTSEDRNRKGNKITYDERVKTYTNALIRYGTTNQLVVALEELSECQKEICKILRGEGNFDHLAEEVADATIMLEQVRLICNCNQTVCEKMDEKIVRLDNNLKKEAGLSDE